MRKDGQKKTVHVSCQGKVRVSELTGARAMRMRASGEISMEEQTCLEKGHGNAFIHLVQAV